MSALVGSRPAHWRSFSSAIKNRLSTSSKTLALLEAAVIEFVDEEEETRPPAVGIASMLVELEIVPRLGGTVVDDEAVAETETEAEAVCVDGELEGVRTPSGVVLHLRLKNLFFLGVDSEGAEVPS
jgi:hypothetical protein